MGTRAVIKFGPIFIATHWDGNPDSLGRDLAELRVKNLESIVNVAKKHTIDCASQKVVDMVSNERFAQIAAKTKGKYSVAQLKELNKEGRYVTFGVQTAGDYPIWTFKGYSDFAEYLYDISSTGQVKYAKLDGEWKGVPKNPIWISLNKSGGKCKRRR